MGGNGIEMAKLLVRICSPFVKTNLKILEQLGRDSEPLRHLMEQYVSVEADLNAVYFYETYKTKLPLGQSILVRLLFGGSQGGRTANLRCRSFLPPLPLLQHPTFDTLQFTEIISEWSNSNQNKIPSLKGFCSISWRW
jgi:hypothetical protein